MVELTPDQAPAYQEGQLLLVQGSSDSGLEPRHSDSSTCGKENIVKVRIISDKYTSVRIIDSDLRYFEWLCQYFQSGLDDHLSTRELLEFSEVI